MRNFLIADYSAMKTSGTIAALSDLQDGQLALVERKGAALKALADTDITSDMKRFDLILGDKDVTGQMRHNFYPIYRNHFSYEVMEYQAATKFTATVTVAAPTYAGVHTIIVAKKGVPFNERNKWSADVYVRDTTMTDAQLATKLADAINENKENSGVEATVSGNTITITALTEAVDYEIKLADELFSNGTTVSVTTTGIAGMADKAMVIDLSNKAIADSGINDTYQEASELMKPRYPITRGAAALADEYDIVTIRFAEPREMKTRDEVVHQIVQIAFARPSSGTKNGQLQDFTDILDKLV